MIERYRKAVNPHWVNALESLGEAQVFVKATGAWLYDAQGRPWLDLVCGYGTAVFGHHHPSLVQALSASLAAQAPALAPLGIPPLSATLCERIAEQSGLPDHLGWLMTSGSEALECAAKLALVHTGRGKLLCCAGGFHGLSALSLGLTPNPWWREGIESVVPGQDSIEVGDLEQARALLQTGHYAALVLEPIQAIGGGKCWPSAAAKELARLCRENGTLLIVDEVLTGIGRCGSFTAMQALDWDVMPDIVVFSKGLTGGLLPLSVMLSRRNVFDSFFGRPGSAKKHGSTFAGNTHAVAVALAVLDLLKDEMQAHNPAHENLRTLHAGFKSKYPYAVEQTRDFGALHFLELDSPERAYALFRALFEERVLVLPCMHAPATLKLLAPLSLEDAALDYYATRLHQCMEQVC